MISIKKLPIKSDLYIETGLAILMHLPYCFQARRTFVEIYAKENNLTDDAKTISKTAAYLELVNQTILPSEIASGQVGNMYTGSIFLGLLSTLCYHLQNETNLTNQKFGFIAYGSGSKAKVFEAEVQENWQSVIEKVPLFQTLDNSHEIDFGTYITLHKKERKVSILTPKNEFVLDFIEKEIRFYWVLDIISLFKNYFFYLIKKL